MPSVATETVTVPRETIDQALIALNATERFLEALAGCIPAPWDLCSEALMALLEAADGTVDADPDDEDSDFSPHYYEVERRGLEEARKGWDLTWADAERAWHPEGDFVFVPAWPKAETAAA